MELSIIVPVYNAEKFLRECLDSVVSKKYDMEVILVNDGSLDSSLTICEEYAKADSRIKVVNKQNGGVSSARNTGIENASGRYIMFLDADDYFTKDAVDIIDKYIKIDKYEFVAMSYASLFENDHADLYEYNIEGGVTNNKKVMDEILYTSSDLNTCWGKLFRRDKIISENIRFKTDLPIGEDYMFVADYYEKCKNVLLSNECILYYRQHLGSAMRRYDMSKRLEFTKILHDYNKKAIERGGLDELMPKMNRYYFSVLTNLFFEFAHMTEDTGKLKSMYKEALDSQISADIISVLNGKEIKEIYKKIEYNLIKRKKAAFLVKYFSLKAAYAKRCN